MDSVSAEDLPGYPPQIYHKTVPKRLRLSVILARITWIIALCLRSAAGVLHGNHRCRHGLQQNVEVSGKHKRINPQYRSDMANRMPYYSMVDGSMGAAIAGLP